MKLITFAILIAFTMPAFAADITHCKSTLAIQEKSEVEVTENISFSAQLIQCNPMRKRGMTEHGLVVRVNGKITDYLLASPTMTYSISLQKMDANETMDPIINYVRATPSDVDNEVQVLEAGQQPFFNRGNGVFEKGPFQSASAATATK